jgi:peptidoglycan hydrolase-like protein with peptidoglycan-binding domain
MQGVTLRRGSTGRDVKRLQLLLNSTKPSPHLSLDGTFGPQTTDAVVRVQRAHGLPGDGVVGDSTWAILGQRGMGTAPQPNAMAPQWMEIAALEVGVHEDARHGYHNQRIIEYHKTTSLAASTD